MTNCSRVLILLIILYEYCLDFELMFVHLLVIFRKCSTRFRYHPSSGTSSDFFGWMRNLM